MLYGLYKNKTSKSYNWWFGEDGIFGSDAWCDAENAFASHYMITTSKNDYNKWMPNPVLIVPAEFTAELHNGNRE